MAFATSEDVGVRLLRELTDAEAAAAISVITSVTGLICELAGQVDADDIDPVPGYYKALCVEKAIGALTNPHNVAQQSEDLGEYSYSQTFPRGLDGGIFLTEREESTVRRIANGGIVSASAHPHGMPHQFVSEDA